MPCRARRDDILPRELPYRFRTVGEESLFDEHIENFYYLVGKPDVHCFERATIVQMYYLCNTPVVFTYYRGM